MKSIVYEGPKELLKKEIEYPAKKAGHAIIKIKAVGICGSDIHAYSGSQPMFDYPKIVGHEIAAEIVESSTFSEGDLVTVIPYYECGECIACRNGKTNACQSLSVIGVHENGGLTEFISVPEEKIVKVNKMTTEQIAMIEPLAISEHAFSRVGAKKDDIVLVSGIGPIGMGVVVMAKYRGAKVIAVDMNEERLAFAKETLGADFILKPSDKLIEEVSEITRGEMVISVFDATGNERSMNNAVNLVSHGGSIVFVGLHKGDINMIDLAFHKREASLFASRAAYKKDFETVIEMIESDFFDPKNFITSTIKFDDFIEEFPGFIENRNQIKGLVTM